MSTENHGVNFLLRSTVHSRPIFGSTTSAEDIGRWAFWTRPINLAWMVQLSLLLRLAEGRCSSYFPLPPKKAKKLNKGVDTPVRTHIKNSSLSGLWTNCVNIRISRLCAIVYRRVFARRQDKWQHWTQEGNYIQSGRRPRTETSLGRRNAAR